MLSCTIKTRRKQYSIFKNTENKDIIGKNSIFGEEQRFVEYTQIAYNEQRIHMIMIS